MKNQSITSSQLCPIQKHLQIFLAFLLNPSLFQLTPIKLVGELQPKDNNFLEYIVKCLGTYWSYW
jgi:hypothetical protein